MAGYMTNIAPPSHLSHVIQSFSNSKDSRWLQIDVCRDFQKGKCSRSDDQCKFAHPGEQVDVKDGKVVACYDSIKGKCRRERPPCRYYHPPAHLKEVLLQNGRNHLALKNALVQQLQIQHLLGSAAGSSNMASGQNHSGLVPNAVVSVTPLSPGAIAAAAVAQATGLPPSYYNANTASANNHHAGAELVNILSAGHPNAAQGLNALNSVALSHLPHPVAMAGPTSSSPLSQHQQSSKRTLDRLEVCREHQRSMCKRKEDECKFAHPPSMVAVSNDNHVTVCMDFVKGRCQRDQCKYFHPPQHLVTRLKQMQHQHHQQQQSVHQMANLNHFHHHPHIRAHHTPIYGYYSTGPP